MSSAQSTRASDKQQAIRKATALLQKEYGRTLPKLKLPVLETMLFAICLEDSRWEDASKAIDNLNRVYFDLNEVRVSSVSELEATLQPLRHADWKGLRIRSLLRFVFESTYTYEYEKLRKMTVDAASRRLRKIDHMTPFVSDFTLQQCLDAFVVAVDESSVRAAEWLGLVPEGLKVAEASEFLKPGVKKSEVAGFTFLLRELANDPKYQDRFSEHPEHEEFDVLAVAERYEELKSPRKKKPVKAAETKSKTVKKKPAKKASDAGTKKPAAGKKKSTSEAAPAAKKSSAAKKKTGSSVKAAAATTTAKRPVRKKK